MVRTNTVVGPGSDSAVVFIKGTNKALAVKTDCNARYVYLDPKEGTKIAVAESARNVVCSGGVPLAITNCLNFGNPYKPEIYWQFKQAIEGMGEACRIFDTPVTGGNVSFYNESPDAAVYPTPVIGMVGLIDDVSLITTSYFKDEGDLIYLLGEDKEEVGGSEYLKVIHNMVKGNAPSIDLQTEKKLHEVLHKLIGIKIIKSAHDVSEGGIITALAESCIINEEKPIGADVNIPVQTREDFSFFSESQSRVIVSICEENKILFEEAVKSLHFPFLYLGKTVKDNLKINGRYKFDLKELAGIYFNTITKIMGG
jgi:phosphoribosylformylglycinamidine synthase